MIFAGLQRSSFSDFPGRVAAVVFTKGCNFRCPYCHNPQLVIGGKTELYEEGEILSFLEKRKGVLGGLVVSGGEPTLHHDLPRFLASVRELGYSIKLDTNGSRPEMIREILESELVDYIAMDIKAPLNRYSEVTRTSIDSSELGRSIELIVESGVDHEFRTTTAKPCVSRDDLMAIGDLVRGGRRYVLQPFVSEHTLDRTFKSDEMAYSKAELIRLSEKLTIDGLKCSVR